jgi:hypothetical protein
MPVSSCTRWNHSLPQTPGAGQLLTVAKRHFWARPGCKGESRSVTDNLCYSPKLPYGVSEHPAILGSIQTIDG